MQALQMYTKTVLSEAKNFGQALQILEKNEHFGTNIPRGRPRKNFGLKSFGLIFRSLISALKIKAQQTAPPKRGLVYDTIPK